MPAVFRSPFYLALCSLCLCGSNSYSAPPRDDLLRLIPDDAGFCMLIQDLRGTIERLQTSPFAARLAESPMGKSFRASPEARQLAAINEQLTTQLGVSAQELRDDIFGDAVALAYTPGPPEKPEQEKGLLLVHARKPERLAALLKRLNETQKRSGELKQVETREDAVGSYTIRRKPAGDEFYAISGSILILSNTESRLIDALKLSRQTPANGEVPVQFRPLQELGVENGVLTFWINPRAFDAAVDQAVNGAATADASGMKTFAACWAALDGAAITVRFDDTAAVSLAVRGRSDALPAGVRRFLDNQRRPALVWSAFPDSALLKLAARVPWEPVGEPPPTKSSIREAFDRGIGKVLGREMLPELLRFLGPDWGVCVERPDASSPGALPSLTAAVRLRGDSPALRQRVLGGIDLVARLAILAVGTQNSTQWKVHKAKQEDVDVRYIDADKSMPAGVQPAYAWKGGYIVLASSPDAIRRFQPPAETDPPASNGDLPLARLAFANWAGYLQSYREPLVEYVADTHKLDRADVRKRLDRLVESLELFDTLDVAQHIADGRATLTLRLRTSEPLRK